MIIKTILTWLWTQISKELTIQQPDPTVLARMQPIQPKQETRQDRIFKTGMNGFAMILLICVGVAVLVF